MDRNGGGLVYRIVVTRLIFYYKVSLFSFNGVDRIETSYKNLIFIKIFIHLYKT